MAKIWKNLLDVDLPGAAQREQLQRRARQRNWGLSLLLVGWLHLLAFSACYYLTTIHEYHERAAYLAIWLAELAGLGLIFRLCGGPRPGDMPSLPLERFLVRVWFSYFVLVFNLASMNTVRGHRLFELFPAAASVASFAFLMMTFTVNPRFFGAVLVMFASGLLMAAHLLHAYLIFALAWWLVLNTIGLTLWLDRRRLGHGAVTATDNGEGDLSALPHVVRPSLAEASSPAERARR